MAFNAYAQESFQKPFKGDYELENNLPPDTLGTHTF